MLKETSLFAAQHQVLKKLITVLVNSSEPLYYVFEAKCSLQDLQLAKVYLKNQKTILSVGAAHSVW